MRCTRCFTSQEAREKRLKEELERYRAENPKITEQFADLKRKLGDVSYEEWEVGNRGVRAHELLHQLLLRHLRVLLSTPCQAIPDIGDYTIKKQRRFERFAPVPDSLLARAAAEATSTSAANAAKSLDPASGLASVGFSGLATPMGGAASTVSDLTAIGEGHDSIG